MNTDQDVDRMTIDTSGMSEGKKKAMEVAEGSRDALCTHDSFCASMFMGSYRWDLMNPWPAQPEEDAVAGQPFLEQLEAYLRDHVDPDQIDADGEIPDEVIRDLGEMGAFGIKVDKAYSGLGLSQTTYSKAAMLLGSVCGNLTALLSAHQSIGVSQPLKHFGTEAQKNKYLPRVARGEISAFALTEEGVGSDPARMTTRAEPCEGGYTLNGEKLWCTNGVKAGVIIVMAQTPPKEVRGHLRDQISAFIVEMDSPGVTVKHRCRFMGLKALYNGVIGFKDVFVPAENIVGGEGKGLKVALTTLNTGRLTIPAACAGLNKRCIKEVRKWANEREQWGAPIGHHAAIADKIAIMTAEAFAAEAMALYTSQLVDRKQGDIRLEAAMCKMYATESSWRTVDETLQIRGGRGFETALSLKARGAYSVPVERWMRDSRINLIFEGSSEIMRLFIAREALDSHLRTGGPVLDTRLSGAQRVQAALKAGWFYLRWYPRQFAPCFPAVRHLDPRLARHIRWAARCSHRLARALFHSMAKHGPALEREQMVLKQLVDIGAELFAMSVAVAHAHYLASRKQQDGVDALADVFCQQARLRIQAHFVSLKQNTFRSNYALARQILKGRYTWFEEGIVKDRA